MADCYKRRQLTIWCFEILVSRFVVERVGFTIFGGWEDDVFWATKDSQIPRSLNSGHRRWKQVSVSRSRLMMAGSLMGDAPTKRMVVLSGPAVMKEISL